MLFATFLPMTKNTLYFLLLLFVFGMGCKSKSRRLWLKQQKENDNAAPPTRDYSITRENAYNDLFLDSLAFETFSEKNALQDSISENMRDFYNLRNFQFAWFDSNGLTEQALGFRSLYKFKTDSVDRKLDNKLDNLLMRSSKIEQDNPEIVAIELALTKRFVQYALMTFKEEMLDNKQFETFIPIKKQPVLALADSVLSKKNIITQIYANSNPNYNQLQKQLAVYRDIYRNGGWMPIPLSKTRFQSGKHYPELVAFKKRLAITGEFAAKDSSDLFTPELESAIKVFQANNGINPDGKITPALATALNVPVLNRIQQLLINMERMRWMPSRKEGKLLLVNIPEFMLHVTENEEHLIHMPVVVGKEGHHTTLFSDDLDEVVFSPYWNLPYSIVKNEILPSMAKNRNYLSEKNMEIVSNNEGGVPTIRQKPGPDNSLGRVKFLFPNSFNIYFHDTPAKSLFSKDDRAASHGCIRLSDPEKMANYLLKDMPEWTPEKIKQAMNSGVEKSVGLKKAVPVIITYYTAWVDENKRLNFRQDVYGNDAEFAGKMFTDAQQ